MKKKYLAGRNVVASENKIKIKNENPGFGETAMSKAETEKYVLMIEKYNNRANFDVQVKL